MSEPWTPGPWTVESDDGLTWSVHAANGNAITEKYIGVDGEVDEANARLISLAPEMAELLGAFTKCEGVMTDCCGICPGCEAKALLARARGEARSLFPDEEWHRKANEHLHAKYSDEGWLPDPDYSTDGITVEPEDQDNVVFEESQTAENL